MMKKTAKPTGKRDSGESFRDLEVLYSLIAEVQAGFSRGLTDRGIAFGCSPDCDSCCRGFTPEVTPIETASIAAFIVPRLPAATELLDLETVARGIGKSASEKSVPDGTCPFLDTEKPGQNCTIYPVRPLICRMFGFAAMRAKYGGPMFTLCRKMPSLPGTVSRSFREPELLALAGVQPPVMSDFAARLAAIDPNGSCGSRSIDEALPPELARLSLRGTYLEL